MNKCVRPEDLANLQSKNSVDQLLRDIQSPIAYRTLEPRIAFDGAAVMTAVAAADQQQAVAVPKTAEVPHNTAAPAEQASAEHAPAPETAADGKAGSVADKSAPAAVPTEQQPRPDGDATGAGPQKTASIGELLTRAAAASDAAKPAATTVIFIDANVEDAKTLLQGADPNAEIVVLDSSRDALKQIAENLAGRTGIDSIHIISHGQEGELDFGYSAVGSLNLGNYATELAAIGKALTPHGDILLYGCDVGKGDKGSAFIKALAGLTGADVAASRDATGHVDFGANWNLEVSTGTIEAHLAVSREAQDAWHLELAVSTHRWETAYAATTNLLGTSSSATTNGVTITVAGSSTGAVDGGTRTLEINPGLTSNGATGLLRSFFDAATDDGSVTNTFTITFSQPAYNVSFTVLDIDGKQVTTFNDMVTVSSGGVFASSVTVGSNVIYDAATGTARSAGAEITDATGNATFTFNGPITTFTIVHRAGAISGSNNPSLETIYVDDITFNTAPTATNNADTVLEDAADSGNVITDNDGFGTDSDRQDGANVSVASVNGTAIAAGGTTVTLANGASLTIQQNGSYLFNQNGAYDSLATGQTATAVFAYTIKDLDGISGSNSTANLTITIQGVNDAPVLDLDASGAGTGWTTTFKENGTAVAIADIDAVVTDSDNANIASGTVVLTNKQTGDRLSIGGTVVANGSTGTINGISYTVVDTGSQITITLAGSAAKATYANTLKAIAFDNTTDTPSTTVRTISVTVNDGALNSNTAVTAINIDLAPDPVDDADSGNEDTTISGNVLTNDTDLGTTPITSVTVATGPSNGTLTSFNTTTGAFVYSPNSNFNGTDTFTYRITDANGDTKTATVTITVNPVNDAPVNTVPGPRTTNEDTPLAIAGVTVADVDGPATVLTTTLTVPAGTGILNIASSAGVTVTGDGSRIVTITGTAAAINAAIATITYTNLADYNTGTPAAPINLTVATTDGSLTDTDTISITVTPIVDIANDAVTTNEDTAVTFAPLGNDSFENAGRTITAINGTAITAGGAGVVIAGAGTVTLDVAGNLTFTPNPNYNGTPSFTYTVTSGGVTETATVNVTVNPVNDAPVNTVPGAQTTTEDGAKIIAGTSVADVDGGTLTTTLTIPAGSGTLAVVGGSGATVTTSGGGTVVTLVGTAAQINAAIASITYTPTADFNTGSPATPINLTVVTSDGALSDTDMIGITVTPVADITNDAVSTSEDNAATFNVMTGTNGATADTFENGGAAVTSVTQGSNGSVSFLASGAIIYTPNANFNGTDTFTYTVTSGGVTETATVTVTVTAVNDPPVNSVPVAQSTLEDTNVVFSTANGNAITVTDVDSNVTTTLTIANGALTLGSLAGVTVTGNGTGTVTVSGTPAAVTAALNGLTFAPTADWNGTTVLNISTSDGVAPAATSTVSITASPVVDIAPDSVTTNEDTAATFNVLTNDSFENPGRLVSSVTQPANGAVTFLANGSVTYTPNANYNGSDSFTYTVTSGGVTETTTVTMTVTPVNDAPTATTPPPQTNIDGAVATYNVSGYYSDVDGDSLTFSATSLPPGLSINAATGQISGTIDGHASTGGAGGVYSVFVKATDPGGLSVTRTFSWTVTNPVPVAGNDTFTGNEDTVLSGNVISNDSDPDGDALTVDTTPVSGPSNGVLVLNSTGTFTYTPNANFSGTDSFTYTLRDADGATTTATVTLNINPVNDNPVLGGPANVSPTEDTPFQFRGGNAITVSDIDSPSVTNTLTVTNGTLTLASFAGVTITGSGSGTLTLAGSPANVTAAMAAMSYRAAADYNGAATLTVSSSDGIGTSAKSIALNVTAVADITPDSVSTTENAGISFNVLTGTNGATADTFEGVPSVTGFTQPANGSVTVAANGTVVYTPNAAFNGTDTFTYTVTSGGVTETTTVTVTVNPINDAPVQTLPPAQSGTEDVTIVFSGANGNQITVIDIDSASVTTTVSVPAGKLNAITTPGVTITGNGTGSVTLTGAPAAITAALNGLTYTPIADANGSVTLTVSTSDGIAAPVTGTVAMTLAPVSDIVDDTASTPEDTSKVIAVLGNDTFENPGRTVSAVNGLAITAGGAAVTVANGTVTLDAGGNLTFTPSPNYNGTTAFNYTVTSGGVTETATVTVVVNPVNDAPTQTVPAAQTTAEDAGLTFSGAGGNAVVVADLDGDALTTTLTVTNGRLNLGSLAGVTVSGNGTGTVVISGSAAAINAALNGLTYNPTSDYNGAAAMTVTTTDGSVTVNSSVPITITPVVDITADTISTNEDTPQTINVLANDTFENPGAAVTNVTQGIQGSVSIGTGGNVTYTPNANYNGPDSFTYTVTSGGVTETVTVSVNVIPVNDPAITVVPGGQNTNEDAALVFSGANGNAITVSDIDTGDTITMTLSGTNGRLTLGSLASVTVAGNGTGTVTLSGSAAAVTAALNGLSFAPNADYNGAALISVSTSDGTATSTNTITVTVAPVADIVADTVSTNEDTSVTFNALANDSFESPGRAVTSVTQGASGSVSFLSDGTLVYNPNANFHGTDTFTYTVTSGGVTETTTVTVNVADVNDPPVTTGLANRNNLDSQFVSVNVSGSFSDADNEPLTYSATGLPAGLTINPVTGVISGTIARSASQAGPYTVTVTASDGHPGGTVSAAFTWAIANPAPTANNDAVSTAEDTAKNIAVLANDTDPDGDPLTVTSASAGNGTVTIKPDGTIDYTPNLNFNGTDTIVYQISDGDGGVSTATVTVTVTPVNDAPVTTGLGDILDSDSQTVSIDVTAAFSDVDGDTLTYSTNVVPPGLTFNPVTGVFSGTLDPSASQGGPYVITVTASDGHPGGTASTTFTWTVLNIPPTANDDSVTTPEDTPVVASVLANDVDPDFDPLVITEINGAPITLGGPGIATPHGSVTLTTDGFGKQVLIFTPAPDWNGVESLVYTTSDNNGGTDTATLTITVTPVNDAPTADPLANLTNNDSETVSVGVGSYFHDVDASNGDTLTFTATGLPTGLTIDSATGVISGTIDRNASQGGPYTVVVTGTDLAGAKVSQNFTWTVVNPAPTAVNDVNSVAEGSNVTVTAASGVLANDSDPDNDPLSVSAINGAPGNVGQPVAGSAGGLFTVNADGSYAFNQNGAFEDLKNGETRVTTVTYRLSDGNGGTSTASLTITVTGANDAPVATSIPNQARLDNTTLTLNAASAFSDVDGDTLTYSLDPGTPLPAGLTLSPAGLISGTIDKSASQGGAGGVYTVTVIANDGQGGTAPVTFTITVTNPAPNAANDVAPVVEDTPASGNVLANDSDPDGDALSLTGFTIAGVPGSFNPGDTATIPGVGTLTMGATGAYTFTPASNYNGPVPTVTYTLADADGASDTATLKLGPVSPVNDAPTSTPIAPQSSNDSNAIALNVSANFTDIDGDALTFSVDPAKPLPPGLSINPSTGLITGTIDHLASASGPYTVTIKATDPSGTTTSQTFTWAVANPAPTGLPIADKTAVDRAIVNIPAGTGFADPDGDTLTFTVTGLPTGLSINAATGLITGTLGTAASAGGPLSNGVYAITVTATDEQGLLVSKSFTYTVSNPAPTAGNDVINGTEDTPLSGSVAANDQDPDGDAVTYAVVTGPVHGTLIFNSNGTFTYTPAANYNASAGTDTFTYKITDAQGAQATATVTLTIQPVNDLPGPAAAALTTPEDTPFSGTLPSSDADGDIVSFTLTTGPSNGTVIVNPNGTYTYTPALNYTGADTFVVRLSDGNGGITLQTVSVTVTPVNDAPVASNTVLTIAEDTTFSGSLPVATDADGDPITYTKASDPIHGTLTVNPGGTYTYDPDLNYNGPDSFTYTVSDGNGGSNTYTVTIHVGPGNDPPVASNATVTTNEDTPVIGSLPVATDADGDPITYTKASDPAHGTLTVNPDGTYVYTPFTDFHGADSFTYTINDGFGGTNTYTVTLTVVSVNDVPVAVNDTVSVTEDTPVVGSVLGNDSDADGDPLSVTQFVVNGTTYPAGATANIPGVGVLVINANGIYTFTPAPNYNGPVPVATYTVTDGTATDTADLILGPVTAVNDPPVASNATVTTNEDTAIIGSLPVATDADGDPVTYTKASNPAHGTLTVNPNGTYVYTPTANYNGPDSFTYTVGDGKGGTNTYTVTVTVAAVNDAPVAVNDIFNGTEDNSISGTVIGNDQDADGDALTVVDIDGNPGNGITPVSGPSNGSLVLNANGTFSYTPAPNFNGMDSFTYRISDGKGGVSEATVTLNVTPVNDRPTAGPGSLTTPEDQPFTGALPAATDVDGDTVTYAKGSNPSHGTVTVNPNGTYTYTPVLDYNGPDSFTYTVSDGKGGVSTYTVTVIVTPVNDVPVISPVKPPVSVDGAKITFNVSTFTKDADGDQLTYSATGLPPGLSINPATGVITGTLPRDASQGGPYTVTLTVSDGQGGVATKTFSWPVTNPAPVAANDRATVKTDHDVVVPVLVNDHDPDGDPLTVTTAKAANGVVDILPDGSIRYTPHTGFAGTDTITYVVSDGNGGYAIASVTITVGDDAYHEKPPQFGYNGPEHGLEPPPRVALVAHEGLSVQGAVLDAVYEIGELHTLGNLLSADGAVLAAANGVRDLGGISSIGTGGVVVETIRGERAHQLAKLAGFERSFQDYKLDGLPGFSMRRNVPGNLGGLSAREQIVIESIVRDQTLIVQIKNTLETGSKRIVEYRITQADGTPLPDWLDRAGKDLLIGRRAADLDTLKLRIEAVYSDGSVVVEEAKIDTATGEIQPLTPGRQGALAPPLFGEQFKARAMLSPDQVRSLGRAISR